MSALAKYLLLIVTFIGITQGVMAQPAETGNKTGNKTTETTTTNATTTANAKKPVTTADKNSAPPSEKKNWAIRIKQGEKWYQLSLELAF